MHDEAQVLLAVVERRIVDGKLAMRLQLCVQRPHRLLAWAHANLQKQRIGMRPQLKRGYTLQPLPQGLRHPQAMGNMVAQSLSAVAQPHEVKLECVATPAAPQRLGRHVQGIFCRCMK